MNNKTVKIRFNTKSNDENNLPKWRVIIDDIEHLTDNVIINTQSWTTKDWLSEENTYKWHITCSATKVTITDIDIQIK